MARISGSHPEDPGSIPGWGGLLDCSFLRVKEKAFRAQRDLNPQPLGLESKALPLRHGLPHRRVYHRISYVSYRSCTKIIFGCLFFFGNCSFVSRQQRTLLRIIRVAGVKVSIVPFQGVDPGSIPGRRNSFERFFLRTMNKIVSLGLLTREGHDKLSWSKTS